MNRGLEVINKYYNKFKFTDYLRVNELNELNESFDTKYKIRRIEKEDTVVYYHLTINDVKYRIILDRVQDAIRIIFDVYRNDEYRTTGVTNKLSVSETLRLFGTIYSVLKEEKFNHLFIDTNEPKKLALYKKMAKKLKNELFQSGDIIIDKNMILIYDTNYSPKISLLNKFKRKIK